jgi:hypothetical protein
LRAPVLDALVIGVPVRDDAVLDKPVSGGRATRPLIATRRDSVAVLFAMMIDPICFEKLHTNWSVSSSTRKISE